MATRDDLDFEALTLPSEPGLQLNIYTAAAGTPTIGLFGPSDDQLYAPWGPNTRVVRGPRSFEQIRAVDPGLSQALCHMMDLPVETVTAAAKDLLAKTQT